MSASDYINLGMLFVAVLSAVFAFFSSRQAREANERLALYNRPVFVVDDFYETESTINLVVRNINDGIATHVNVHLTADTGNLVFKAPSIAGAYSGIAGKDGTVSVYCNLTFAAWERLGLTGSSVDVEFDTTAGEHMGQTLMLRQPTPKALRSRRASS